MKRLIYRLLLVFAFTFLVIVPLEMHFKSEVEQINRHVHSIIGVFIGLFLWYLSGFVIRK